MHPSKHILFIFFAGKMSDNYLFMKDVYLSRHFLGTFIRATDLHTVCRCIKKKLFIYMQKLQSYLRKLSYLLFVMKTHRIHGFSHFHYLKLLFMLSGTKINFWDSDKQCDRKCFGGIVGIKVLFYVSSLSSKTMLFCKALLTLLTKL